MSIQKNKIVVLIPCLNEEITIGKVISDFQNSIPEAQIIVFDNNSTDRTATVAQEHGAEVQKELRPGKGNVMASMFRKVEADYYIIVLSLLYHHSIISISLMPHLFISTPLVV